MKITIEGTEYEFVPLANPNGSFQYAGLKPVKKTESKDTYTVMMVHQDFEHDFSKDLSLTPTTANKLSEAISALVTFLEDGVIVNLEEADINARKSFQESQ